MKRIDTRTMASIIILLLGGIYTLCFGMYYLVHQVHYWTSFILMLFGLFTATLAIVSLDDQLRD
mgnify:CR=1 FL=1